MRKLSALCVVGSIGEPECKYDAKAILLRLAQLLNGQLEIHLLDLPHGYSSLLVFQLPSNPTNAPNSCTQIKDMA